MVLYQRVLNARRSLKAENNYIVLLQLLYASLILLRFIAKSVRLSYIYYSTIREGTAHINGQLKRVEQQLKNYYLSASNL
jgi:hypothetical protein